MQVISFAQAKRGALQGTRVKRSTLQYFRHEQNGMLPFEGSEVFSNAMDLHFIHKIAVTCH